MFSFAPVPRDTINNCYKSAGVWGIYFFPNRALPLLMEKIPQRLLDKTSKYKEQLFERPGKAKGQTTLRAAQIELNGNQIPFAIERGKTYNHIQKVEGAQNGLLNHVEDINNRLSFPDIPPIERSVLQEELSRASKLLDYTEEFVPRHNQKTLSFRNRGVKQ